MKTITLTDTDMQLLQFILNTCISDNAVDLGQLIPDQTEFGAFVNEYKRHFHIDSYVDMSYIRPESIAYFLLDRIQEQTP